MGINLRMALKALGQNRLQSILTLLGMSVGVAMVVVVSGLGLGAQRRIESQIESAGPTRVTIRPGNFVPPGVDTNGEQDGSGGEPGEGMISAAAGSGAGGDGSAMPDITQDTAAIAARKRVTAVKRTMYKSPATPLGSSDLALVRAMADVTSVAGAVQGNASLDAGANLPAVTVRLAGFDPAWPEMTGWKLVEGRLPSAREQADGAAVAVVTKAAAERLWPDAATPPGAAGTLVGKVIPVGGRSLKLVGVIAGEQEGKGGEIVPRVHVSNTVAQPLLGRTDYDTITVRTTSIAVTSDVAKAVEASLRRQHGLARNMADDFRVETQSNAALPGMGSDPGFARAVHSNSKGFEQASWEEMAKSLRQAGRTFTYLLAGAAVVSLVVGGIGVMNMMIVSVTARTREIGLRMALGARAGDVMVQFLVEAVTLAGLGGLIGLALGSIGLLVTDRGFHWATAVSPVMMAVAVGAAAIVGIGFGFGPARRAARLDPVIALRTE